jgi:hypothetical protein
MECCRLLPNETVKNLCSGSVSFVSLCSHENMETPTQPLPAKTGIQTPGDEPTFSTALWVILGFIVFAALIFTLVVYGPV